MLILELIGEEREGRVVSRTLAGWRRARALLSSGLQPSSLRGTDMTPFTIHFISTDGKFVESLHHSDVQQISVSLARRVACGEYVDIFNANSAAEYQYIYKPMRQRLTLAALKHYS